jgi:Na+-driven multidrug efflux pump
MRSEFRPLLRRDTLVSQAAGAGNLPDGRHSLPQAFWLAAISKPILLAALWALIPLMNYWGLDPAVLNIRQLPPLGVNGIAWATVGARVCLALYLDLALRRLESGALAWELPHGPRIRQLFLLDRPADTGICFACGEGVTGLWIGLSPGLAVVAALLVLRWRRTPLHHC